MPPPWGWRGATARSTLTLVRMGRSALRPCFLFRCYSCLANTDDCLSRIPHFDLDRCIVPDGLCVTAERTHVRRRRNCEGVALDPDREVNNAVRADGAGCDACVRYDVQVWITCP